jgi:TonB family protein
MMSQVDQRWPHRKWWAGFSLVLALQISLIFLLSDRAPAKVRRPSLVPRLQFVGDGSAEFLALNDPTLFARPHAQGFAGGAWLKMPRLESRQFDWSEPTNWLALTLNQVRPLKPLTEVGPSGASLVASIPQPRLSQPGVLPPTAAREESAWRLEGDLRSRALATSLDLPSWAHSELLTNTIVRLMVDAEGRVFSAPILLTSSNHKPADDFALAAARSLRFEPTNRDSARSHQADLTYGTLVFEWQTIPAPPTNAAPPVVQP